MPSWLNLTSISAAITVAAFIAEVFKAFPRYAELRRAFLLVSGGFFLGSILTAASGIRIAVAGSDSPFVLLMVICAVGTVIFLLAAILTETPAKKTEYYLVMGGTIAAFLGLLVINSINSSGPLTSANLDYYDLTFSEKIILADAAQHSSNLERATYMVELALKGLDDADPRARALKTRLDRMRRQQVANDLSAMNDVE